MTHQPITLEEIIRRRWNQKPASPGAALAVANLCRQRELRLRRWLPPALVRRLDKVFARSNTVHPATGRALYAICRAMRPAAVFETGTYWGYATAYLAAAVADNGAGHVWTFDLHPEAGKHLPAEFHSRVTLVRGRPATDSLPEILARVRPELFFQDSVHDYDGVLAELRAVLPSLSRDAVVLFHDYVAEGVRRAAVAGLPGWSLYQLDHDDPQQLGVAFREPI